MTLCLYYKFAVAREPVQVSEEILPLRQIILGNMAAA